VTPLVVVMPTTFLKPLNLRRSVMCKRVISLRYSRKNAIAVLAGPSLQRSSSNIVPINVACNAGCEPDFVASVHVRQDSTR